VPSHPQCYLQSIADTQQWITGKKAGHQQAAEMRSLAGVPLQIEPVF